MKTIGLFFMKMWLENDDFLDFIYTFPCHIIDGRHTKRGRHFDFRLWTGAELWQTITGICLNIIIHMAENIHFQTLSFFRSFDEQYNLFMFWTGIELWKIIYEIWSTTMCSSCIVDYDDFHNFCVDRVSWKSGKKRVSNYDTFQNFF